MKRVLFLCTGNSCRSQMAEGWLRHLAGERFEAYSAGTQPTAVNPLALRVMGEKGIDISGQRSKDVAEYAKQRFDFVITVCDRAQSECPVFPGSAVRFHWPLQDPAEAQGSDEERSAVFRRTRDVIEERVRNFLKAN
ncbi:MAG TPA: arsenate reductase ArsC [Terriglobales bacterium]